jgi:hypothetical protein
VDNRERDDLAGGLVMGLVDAAAMAASARRWARR